MLLSSSLGNAVLHSCFVPLTNLRDPVKRSPSCGGRAPSTWLWCWRGGMLTATEYVAVVSDQGPTAGQQCVWRVFTTNVLSIKVINKIRNSPELGLFFYSVYFSTWTELTFIKFNLFCMVTLCPCVRFTLVLMVLIFLCLSIQWLLLLYPQCIVLFWYSSKTGLSTLFWLASCFWKMTKSKWSTRGGGRCGVGWGD